MVNGNACFAYFNKIWGILSVCSRETQRIKRQREMQFIQTPRLSLLLSLACGATRSAFLKIRSLFDG